MIERYVTSASTFSADIDFVITLIFVLVGFWFLVCEVIFFWLIFRFRKKDGVEPEYITGEEKSQKRWITYPHLLVLVCDVFIVVAAVRVWYDVKQNLPPAERKNSSARATPGAGAVTSPTVGGSHSSMTAFQRAGTGPSASPSKMAPIAACCSALAVGSK